MNETNPKEKAKIQLPCELTSYEFAGMIDHTLLKHEATVEDIRKLCWEAMNYNFISVCVRPYYVQAAKQRTETSNVKVCTVISFDDEGTSIVKPDEAMRAIDYGADEIDIVMNYRALRNGYFNYARRDLESVIAVVKAKEKLAKVILETAALSEHEITDACRIVKASGADYVKTSTGKIQGATPRTVDLMRYIVGDKFGVKASGGIKTLEDAIPIIAAGVPRRNAIGFFRLGTSSSVQIIEEYLKLIQEPA